MGALVLSLFPGIGLLDMAFEEEGFCVVRGPDLLWGGDVRRFHPPAGRFDGVIGGPPCQAFSPLANVNRARYGEDSIAENLIPEYERVVAEALPDWFVMENVPAAPVPCIAGYSIHSQTINNRDFGAIQNRERRFSFGTRDGRRLILDGFAALYSPVFESTVTTRGVGGRRAKLKLADDGTVVGRQGRKAEARLRVRPIEEEAELQGLPRDFLANGPLTAEGRRRAIGNGVPLPMGRAIARAVKRALAQSEAA